MDRQPSVWKGLVAGAVGGLVGTFVMTRFQNAMARLGENLQSNGDRSEQRQEAGEPATVKAAQAITKRISGKSIPEDQKELAGEVVHYAMGIVNGALYGMVVERVPTPRASAGLLFGGGVWAVADEVAVPALKLSGMPWEYGASTHASALVAHLVYGGTTWAVAAGVRALL